MIRLKVRPFVKWAGGKRQLLPKILDIVPDDFERYFEPFVGAGALFFALQSSQAILFDINNELINTYQVIKADVEGLIPILKQHEKKDSERYYYTVRGLATRKTKMLGIPIEELWNTDLLSPVEKAARFIYLNRTCYNGLYRVNSKNEFNVPYGDYKKPAVCSEDNLRDVNKVLNETNAEIKCADFFRINEHGISEGDLIYFDPPYFPISDTSSFTGYTEGGFDYQSQKRLCELFKYASSKNAYCILSNSDTPLIQELYDGFNIRQVNVNRAINSNAKKRTGVSELLITNF